MSAIITAVISFVTSMFQRWYAEVSRDRAQRDLGAAQADNEFLNNQVERGVDAKKTSERVSDLSDDELDELMRRTRDEHASKH